MIAKLKSKYNDYDVRQFGINRNTKLDVELWEEDPIEGNTFLIKGFWKDSYKFNKNTGENEKLEPQYVTCGNYWLPESDINLL